MRGSVTDLIKEKGYGFILGEDGCISYLDEKAVHNKNFNTLTVGDWVEYELQGLDGLTRAVNVKPITRPQVRAQSNSA